MSKRRRITDPVEREIAEALQSRGIAFTHESDGVWPAN
jgi:signal recognition particle subunit SEC65